MGVIIMADKQKEIVAENRDFLKANQWGKPLETDQNKGKPAPPPQKSYAKDSKIIDLIPVEKMKVGAEVAIFCY